VDKAVTNELLILPTLLLVNEISTRDRCEDCQLHCFTNDRLLSAEERGFWPDTWTGATSVLNFDVQLDEGKANLE
jgi:hypothetical protein